MRVRSSSMLKKNRFYKILYSRKKGLSAVGESLSIKVLTFCNYNNTRFSVDVSAPTICVYKLVDGWPNTTKHKSHWAYTMHNKCLFFFHLYNIMISLRKHYNITARARIGHTVFANNTLSTSNRRLKQPDHNA